MRSLGVTLEHARYFTRHDLLALTCVQYEHVNLAALWNLLEVALLAPQNTESTISARGVALGYREGRVHAQTPGAWLATLTTTSRLILEQSFRVEMTPVVLRQIM